MRNGAYIHLSRVLYAECIINSWDILNINLLFLCLDAYLDIGIFLNTYGLQ